jgi:PPM family protein phosphatase
LLIVETATHPGPVRTNNEDLTFWDANLTALAIADGMGGHNAGEVASRLAIDSVQAFLASTAGDGAMRWPFGFDATASLAWNRLRTAFMLANREVFRTSEERPECAGMGTTLTAGLVAGSRLTFANVGDSRLYLFRGGTLRQLTRDDSLVGELSGVPGVDPSTLERHPMRHLLTNVLGRHAEIDLALDETELADGDTLRLSTDGLHGVVRNELIAETLQRQTDLKHAADALIQAALDAQGRDNISVVLARYSAHT